MHHLQEDWIWTYPQICYCNHLQEDWMAQNIREFFITFSGILWLLDAWTKIEWHVVISVCNLQSESTNKGRNWAGAFVSLQKLIACNHIRFSRTVKMESLYNFSRDFTNLRRAIASRNMMWKYSQYFTIRYQLRWYFLSVVACSK